MERDPSMSVAIAAIHTLIEYISKTPGNLFMNSHYELWASVPDLSVFCLFRLDLKDSFCRMFKLFIQIGSFFVHFFILLSIH